LGGLHGKVQPGSKVVMIDNRFVEGSSTPIARTDKRGNTYQLRQLKHGSQYEVLKNFPSEVKLREQIKGFGRDIRVHLLPYYWLAEYETIGEQPAAPDADKPRRSRASLGG
jgi:hypothetical protein